MQIDRETQIIFGPFCFTFYALTQGRFFNILF